MDRSAYISHGVGHGVRLRGPCGVRWGGAMGESGESQESLERGRVASCILHFCALVSCGQKRNE